MNIFQFFLTLAEKMSGQAVTGQLARDVVWLISACFGFWLLVLLALSPFLVLQALRNRRERY